MADKKRISRNLHRLQSIKTWQLVIVFILACFIAATLLRLNNIGMVQRRDDLLSADKTGDTKSIQNRLYDLQTYVTSHMNADLGQGVYLQQSYLRDFKEDYAKISGSYNPNGNIYKKAQQVCEPQFTHWSEAYVQCTVNQLGKYPAASSLIHSAQLPTVNMYRYDFVSPLWSPDFAGFAVLVCVVIFIMILARATSVIILRIILKHRYQSI